MKREYTVVVEQDEEGFFVASVPEIKGCHTQARSLDELQERTREAIELCLEAEDEEVADLRFVGIQRIAV